MGERTEHTEVGKEQAQRQGFVVYKDEGELEEQNFSFLGKKCCVRVNKSCSTCKE